MSKRKKKQNGCQEEQRKEKKCGRLTNKTPLNPVPNNLSRIWIQYDFYHMDGTSMGTKIIFSHFTIAGIQTQDQKVSLSFITELVDSSLLENLRK